MKRYLKLVNFEFNRFAKLYAVLLAITIIVQIAGVIVVSKNYLNTATKAINEDMIPKAQFLMETGPMSMIDIISSVWFLGPIALCIAAVAFYIFFIWYRDWFGKNTFIYRLLMLPTARLNVFLAKITTVLLSTFGFVALQLILLPVESTILKWMVPKEFRLDLSPEEIIGNMPELAIIMPQSFTEFILYYGTGFMGVAILFTAILFERSYRLKGILFGAIYGAVAIIIFLSPILVEELLLIDYFYPLEIIALETIMGLFVIAGSILTSQFLLNKRIRV
ncbi:hypothetical protein F3157_02580 [Virgibacillus dakarensis]|uniref:hypothetical protein n=1 Tax=Virgibacillus dakarensis TaxID=1917889 RepID=UPI000B44EFBC|nr:hypothetical protein [Virgibacillus dakarensis]MBT2214859.1 hypothetical protein [Virgibacillus dakarensis]MTW84546.1 hypothetical protein [Virgibacillus dakarensis]